MHEYLSIWPKKEEKNFWRRGVSIPLGAKYFSYPILACLFRDKIWPQHHAWSCGVVVITSALHAEGPQFDPGRDQLYVLTTFFFAPTVILHTLHKISFEPDLNQRPMDV